MVVGVMSVGAGTESEKCQRYENNQRREAGRGPSIYSSHVFAQYSPVLYGICRTLDKVTSKECDIGYLRKCVSMGKKYRPR
jgi:hypothetical protein